MSSTNTHNYISSKWGRQIKDNGTKEILKRWNFEEKNGQNKDKLLNCCIFEKMQLYLGIFT